MDNGPLYTMCPIWAYKKTGTVSCFELWWAYVRIYHMLQNLWNRVHSTCNIKCPLKLAALFLLLLSINCWIPNWWRCWIFSSAHHFLSPANHRPKTRQKQSKASREITPCLPSPTRHECYGWLFFWSETRWGPLDGPLIKTSTFISDP